MRLPALLSVVLASSCFALPAVADTTDKTCRFLEVIGSNDGASVSAMLDDIAPNFSAERRSSASQSLEALVSSPIFNGGSAWRIAALGNDLEEHLVILRLTEGEVAGGRLRYEWSPDGLALVSLEFQRQYAEYTSAGFLMTPEPITCGS
ncbi:hypothetical protein [Tropicimonas sp. S265A]|uniref:hypothetical protein n=1 Tax=Tropicimonas sp. S265A TaxID=3415134 RepID=UPI003C7E4511